MFDILSDMKVISSFSKAINILSIVKTALTVGIIVFSVLTGYKNYKLLKTE